MKRLCQWMCIVGLVAASSMGRSGLAQESSEVRAAAVVSLKSFNEFMSDISYLTRTAGTPELGGLVTVMASQYTDGIHTSKPIGMYVAFDGEMPTGVAFVPVTDLDKVLAKVREQVGEPEDAGNGVYRLQLNREIFIKERDGYAYISDSVSNLSRLPRDPVSLLGGLQKEYDLGVRVFLQNIPAALRDKAIESLREGVDEALEKQLAEQGAEGNAAEAEKLARGVTDSVVTFIQEADQITLGWNVDAANKAVYLEETVTAKSGTSLAKQFALLSEAKSGFSGFLQADAAFAGNICCKLSPEQARQLAGLLSGARDAAVAKVDEDPKLEDPAAKKSVREAVQGLFGAIQKTVESGLLDGGFLVDLSEGSLTIAGGGRVANERAIEAAIVKLVQVAEEEADFPGLEYNVATHDTVRFHRMTVPVREEDEEALELFGEEVDLHIGLGEGAVYLAMGPDGLELLETAIDDSKAAENKTVVPLKLSLALGPILTFASEQDDDPVLALLAESLAESEGNDHLTVTGTARPNGVAYRLQLEEGILQAIGQAAKAQQQRAAQGE